MLLQDIYLHCNIMKDNRHECPCCHIEVKGTTTICPCCSVGIAKGNSTPQPQSKTSFNPGGDKATACDLNYEGVGKWQRLNG